MTKEEQIKADIAGLEGLASFATSVRGYEALLRAIDRLRADLDRCDEAKWETVRVLVFRYDDDPEVTLLVSGTQRGPEDVAIITARIPRRQAVEVDGETEVVR